MRCSFARGGGRGWLPCPLMNLSCDLNAAVIPAATPKRRMVSGEQRMEPFATPYSLFAKLLLLSGNRLGRSLARARIGVGALAAHRQTAAMTQAAIAAEVHQTLDIDAGLATQIALDHIVAVDHFADLQNFLVAQLADAAVQRDLHLLHDLGRILLADAMDVLKRNQGALVGRDIHAGNTGHGLLSCRRSLTNRAVGFQSAFALSSLAEHDLSENRFPLFGIMLHLGRASANANTTPFPLVTWGPASSENYPTWM